MWKEGRGGRSLQKKGLGRNFACTKMKYKEGMCVTNRGKEVEMKTFTGLHNLFSIGRFHTRGRTSRLDGQIVWHLFVWCEFMSYFVSTGKSPREKSSFQTDKYQTICSSKNLFVPFAHQTIRLSETIRPSRRFVCLPVWQRPLTPCPHERCAAAKLLLPHCPAQVPVKVDTTLNAANIVNGATPERLYIIKDAMIWYQREVEQFRYDLAG